MYAILKQLTLPPASLLLACGLGLWLAARGRKGGLAVAGSATALLAVLAMPVVGSLLMAWVEPEPRALADEEMARARAIVVLSAEARPLAPEYGGPTIGDMTLQRLRYAARLHRRTGLPVLVSGGSPRWHGVALAVSMKRTLEEDFAVPVAWVEPDSADTLANARNSAALLRAEGIGRVVLVTSAAHMARAQAAFAEAGLEAVPAPTGFTARHFDGPAAVIPSAAGLHRSFYALHELIGVLYYRVARL
ncbi:MAG: YdcF family protein [Rhodospirillales bacterium]|nr:YdcF family protein [Rhodospirillales bacterium]